MYLSLPTHLLSLLGPQLLLAEMESVIMLTATATAMVKTLPA